MNIGHDVLELIGKSRPRSSDLLKLDLKGKVINLYKRTLTTRNAFCYTQIPILAESLQAILTAQRSKNVRGRMELHEICI
jgi:hypothetical protein